MFFLARENKALCALNQTFYHSIFATLFLQTSYFYPHVIHKLPRRLVTWVINFVGFC